MACKLNRVKCYISGYTVIVSANADNPAAIDVSLVNSCETMRRACDAKQILAKVAEDWLNAVGANESVYSDCYQDCNDTRNDVDYFYGDFRLVVPTAATPPATPVSTYVAFPFKCESVQTFA